MQVAVIGGDKRQVSLCALLAREGHRVRCFALEKAALPLKAEQAGCLLSCVYGAEWVLLGIPSEKGGTVFAPLSVQTIAMEELLGALWPGQVLCGGGFSAQSSLAAVRGGLRVYAGLRGQDEDTLRDTVLSDFGFDRAGKKNYSLGGNTLEVSLDRDLHLVMFDCGAGKTVKSVPKKNADPTLYEAAKADIAELRKNIKRVVKSRSQKLFNAFLTGQGQNAEGRRIQGHNDWKAIQRHRLQGLLRQTCSEACTRYGKPRKLDILYCCDCRVHDAAL